MDETTIDKICLEDDDIRPYYFGTIASDEFPSPPDERIPSMGLFIVNSDPRSMRGSHWSPLALGMEEPKKCAWMDSFGEKPPPQITKILLSQGWNVEYNARPFQNPISKSCGVFSIYFLKLWACGYTSKEIVTKYLFDAEQNLFKNEALVEQFIRQAELIPRRSPLVPTDIINKKDEEP